MNFINCFHPHVLTICFRYFKLIQTNMHASSRKGDIQTYPDLVSGNNTQLLIFHKALWLLNKVPFSIKYCSNKDICKNAWLISTLNKKQQAKKRNFKFSLHTDGNTKCSWVICNKWIEERNVGVKHSTIDSFLIMGPPTLW